jgi:transposase-like protein
MTFFRNQLINQRVQEGASVRDVAQEFGTTTGAVTLAVLRSGGSFPEAKWRNKKIVERIQEGASRQQIARELNISLRVVDQEIRRDRDRTQGGAP